MAAAVDALAERILSLWGIIMVKESRRIVSMQNDDQANVPIPVCGNSGIASSRHCG